MPEAFGPNPGDNASISESTPILRADATDDDLGIEFAKGGLIPKPEDTTDDDPATVEADEYEPVVVSDVLHGMRKVTRDDRQA